MRFGIDLTFRKNNRVIPQQLSFYPDGRWRCYRSGVGEDLTSGRVPEGKAFLAAAGHLCVVGPWPFLGQVLDWLVSFPRGLSKTISR